MLALGDPYDPAQNSNVRMGDASYFKGHYYLYFGAAPAAVLMLPYDLATGRELGTTTAIFIFCSVGFLTAAGLWLAVRRRYFPDSSSWIAPAGVLLLGLANHALALERRPFVWELPIAAGYAFSMLALAAIYAALHGRRPALWLGLGGLALGLAVGSRPTCLLGAVMFLPALVHLRRTSTASPAWWRSGLAAALGLGVCLLAICVHNYARFGNPFEFGQNYQLSGIYESKAHHFRVAYLLHNFSIYYLHWPDWTRGFPFIAATAVHGGPEGYLGGWNEAICGVLVTLPLLWFALGVPLCVRQQHNKAASALTPVVLAVVAYFFVMTTVILAYFVATPRYLVDFTPSLCLLAMCGWLALEKYFRASRARPAFTALAGLLCAVTLISAMLLSFDYHGRSTRGRWVKVEDFVNSWFGK